MVLKLPYVRQFLISAALFLLAILLAFSVSPSRADELDDVTGDLARQQQQLADLEKRRQQLSKDIASASISLSQVSAELSDAEKELSAIERDLAAKEKELAEWEANRDALVRELYKQNRVSSLEILFSADDLEGSAHQFQYYNESLKNLTERIAKLAGQVTVFKSNRAAAKKLRDELAALRSQYAASVAYSQSQYSSTSNQLIQVKSTIKDLTAKQEQLIAAKIGNSLATGGLALSDDPNSRVDFNPGFSPAFAGFSFGAYTHRNGMSQYGALGRAKPPYNQTAEQILSAYFPGANLDKNYSVPTYIWVNGTNEYNQNFNCQKYAFNDYVKRLYEVPSSWPVAVLRAQATLARSYAIRYVNSTSRRCTDSQGVSRPYICPSQSCQVVKEEINAVAWQQQVDYTQEWVLTGAPTYQYSSTTGGYLNTSGWDTTSGGQGSWPDNAYENIGGSPWFYKGWYKNLAKQTCGRTHPWLTENQFADILNAWVVYTKGNSADKSRVTTWDTGCWGGSPYSISQMKSRAEALGDSYINVSGVAASYSSNGYTSLISLLTDKGAITIDGQIFKDIFNLRSPGYLAIKTPLYNIEKK